MIQILFPLLSILPLGLVALVLRLWREWAGTSPAVVRKPARRQAGDSTRKRIVRLDRQIQEVIGLALALAPILGASYFFSIRNVIEPPPLVWVPHLALAVIIYVCLCVRFARVLGERVQCQQKLDAERIVGKVLDQLAEEGCHIFHDVPLTTHSRIQHVVSTPSGVYAMQSLSRRRAKWCQRQRPHEVIYDGRGLQFPNYYDGQTLERTRRLADELSQLLSDALDTEITVKPALGLPGWLIRRETDDRIVVLNEFECHRLNSPADLPNVSPEALVRIAAYLEGRCRS